MEDNIFIGMSGGFGPLAQVLPITDILKESGYNIWMNIHRNARDMVKREGYNLIEFPNREVPKNAMEACREWWNLGFFFCKYGYSDDEYVKRLVEDYIEVYKQKKINLVIAVLDPICFIAAKVLNLPIISVTQSCFCPDCEYGQLNWWDEMPENLPNAVEGINKVLDCYGIDRVSRIEELSYGDMTIIPSFPEFDPLKGYDDVIYTGIMCWQGVSNERKFEFLKEDVKNIYVYTGHFYDSGGKSGMLILETVIEAFKDKKDIMVYVTTGLGQDLPDGMEIPENVKIYEWLPINDILDKFDLVLHHGGQGISLQAIASQVVSVIVPTFDEREYNARQVEKLGVGKLIELEELSGEYLYETCKNAMSDEGMKQRLISLKENIESQHLIGKEGVAEKIIEFLNKKGE